MKLTTITGKKIEYDDLAVKFAIDTVWHFYDVSGNKNLETAHNILCCLAYGKVEK